MSPVAVVAAVVALVANAFFVAAEFALVASRRTRLERMASQGGRVAAVALGLQKNLSLHLAGAQLGITVASLLLGFVAEPSLGRVIEGALEDTGWLDHERALVVGAVITLTVVVTLHMVLGEMVPKNLAIAAPETTLLLLAVPIWAYSLVGRPVIAVLNGAANLILRAVGVTPTDELALARTPEELAHMVDDSTREGYLGRYERALLTGVLRFPERTVAEVMVPVDRIVAVPVGATVAEVNAAAARSGHSRIVLHRGNLDEVVGYVHVKDLLELPPDGERRPVPLRRVHRILQLSPADPLPDALLAMRRARIHLAVVRDGGRTVGLVSLEDIIEALVGAISDEHDRTRRPTGGTRAGRPGVGGPPG